MAVTSQNAEFRILLAGEEVAPGLNWEGTKILANFDDENQNAGIETESFDFVGRGYQILKERVDRGLSGGLGIFHGVDFKIEVFNENNVIESFTGYVDLTEGAVWDDENSQVSARIVRDADQSKLDAIAASVSVQELYQKGHIRFDQVNSVTFIVEKKTDPLATAMVSVMTFLVIKEITSAIEEQNKNFSRISSIGDVLKAAKFYLLRLVYYAAIGSAILELLNVVLELFGVYQDYHYCMPVQRIIKGFASSLGLGVKSEIRIPGTLCYLPSNNNFNTQEGFLVNRKRIIDPIPRPNDYGYLVSEVLQLVKDLYNVKIKVDGENLLIYDYQGNPTYFENIRDDYDEIKADYQGLGESEYIIPDVLDKPYRFNTDEVSGNLLMSFDTDTFDEYTIDEYQGTALEVRTTAKSEASATRNLLKGNREIDFGLALGKKYGGVSGFRNLLNNLFSLLTIWKGIFGVRLGFTEVQILRESLVFSSHNYSKPKLIIGQSIDQSTTLRSGGDNPIIINDQFQTYLTAKYIYETFHKNDISFAAPYRGQKRIYENVKIPFGMSDFVKISNNNIANLEAGGKAVIRRLEWDYQSDFALITFEIREPYTFNIEEEIFEPS
ncbi:MAG: hypothetical protein HRT61_00905 [Ekhidna sp.]|nr:hypothetical protein [Ekhidna sp.]